VLQYPDKRFATSRARIHRCRRSGDCAIQCVLRVLSPLGAQEWKHGTFADCEKRLPYIAEMGFNAGVSAAYHPISAM